MRGIVAAIMGLATLASTSIQAAQVEQGALVRQIT